MSATCFQFLFSWRLWPRTPSLPVTQNCTKILFLGKGGCGVCTSRPRKRACRRV